MYCIYSSIECIVVFMFLKCFLLVSCDTVYACICQTSYATYQLYDQQAVGSLACKDWRGSFGTSVDFRTLRKIAKFKNTRKLPK